MLTQSDRLGDGVITFLVLGALVLLASLPSSAHASGTYPPVVPAKPPVGAAPAPIDTRTYETGKKVFTGRLPFAQYLEARSAEQAPRLKLWQERLPRSAARTVNLPNLAGRLSEYQMQSLEYYLAVRYRISTR